MTPIRKLSRRSFLARIGGGIALGGSLSGCVGFSDADPYDPIGGGGYGRGGYGRGGRRGTTDSDPDDPVGGGGGYRGVGQRGASDNDPDDPVGGGRGDRRRGRRGRELCSDSDGGSNADPGGAGRRC